MFSPALRSSCKLISLLLTAASIVLLVASSAAARHIAAYPMMPPGYSSIKVFDRKGNFVGRIQTDKRYWVSINRIPAFLQKAVVAIEDSRFYEHGGIDVRGIARALVKDVMKGRMAEGGSTITQQLIKNKYLSGEKTLDRKLKEAQLAMDFEKKYTKREILEMYLNEIYFGNGAWGIVQASRLYFDKNPDQLTDAECALLAGVPKAPGRYNPLGDPSRVRGRRNLVIKRMAELNIISARQQRLLSSQPVSYVKRGEGHYYLAHVKNLLVERYGEGIVEQGGLEVTAALDLSLQKQAEQILREGVKHISPQLQGALLSMDTKTGDLLAAVGGVDFTASGYDRAFTAKRQPGSAVKPFIYAAALEKGYTPAGFWNDTPVSYSRGSHGAWQPRNYEGKRYGELTLRKALAFSNNVIAVKLLESVGVNDFVNFAGTVGLPFHENNGLSLALGTEEVTLNQLVAAYAPFANGGLRPQPRSIIRIFDRNRNVWTETPPSLTPAISPAAAFVTSSMLRDVLIYGTAKNLEKFSREYPSAGKTGTTDDYRDAWFIGYTPEIVTGVWVGYDKPKPGGAGFTGGAISAPIWGRFMRSAMAGRPASEFGKPDTVVSARIDPSTGYMAAPDCPAARDEYFIAGTEPTEYCPEHGGAAFQPMSTAVPPPITNGAPGNGGQTPAEEGDKD